MIMRHAKHIHGRSMSAALVVVLVLGAAAPALLAQSASTSGTHLILLGTGGGPNIRKSRAQPANALIVNGSLYIVDAGNGVARQLALAGIAPTTLRAVFITHNHSDHVADYGTLLLRAWESGLKRPVETFGPPPLVTMTRRYMQYMDWDIQLRILDEGRPQFEQMVHAHDVTSEGIIFQDDNVRVTAAEVTHGAAKPAYAYRFDTADRSIVFSGDTTKNTKLIALARRADVLVHEVLNPDAVDAMVAATDPGNAALRRHILEAHTPMEDVGAVAAEARVKQLVLTHFVPSGLEAFDRPELWMQGVAKNFKGEIVVGEDLMEIR
jgi:ribonuclease BN (tRNA processing enzyme)